VADQSSLAYFWLAILYPKCEIKKIKTAKFNWFLRFSIAGIQQKFFIHG
jgi:hypothetical protein